MVWFSTLIPFLSAEGFSCDPPTSGPGPRGEFLGCRTERAGEQGETDRGKTVRPGPHGSWPLRCGSEGQVLRRGRWWIRPLADKYLCPLQGTKSYFREKNSYGNQSREVILNLHNKLLQE